MTAPPPLPEARAWALTDGKAGDEAPCLGLLDALGVGSVERRRVAPRRLFAWLGPRGPVDPRERPERPGSPLAPPWPDLVVAAGRRSLPYLRFLRARSDAFTVFLRDPRIGSGVADLVWVATHDWLRGENVIVTQTGPHRVSAARLAAARDTPDPRLDSLPRPRVAVLVGGDSRHGRWRPDDAGRFAADLERLSEGGGALMITASRRTPEPLRAALRALAAARGGFAWDGEGENPYLPMLARADAVVVTADSVNMVTEAVATGAPVLLFAPANLYRRHAPLYASLARQGLVKPFAGRLEAFRPEPLDATPVIAAAVAAAYQRHRDALASATRRAI